MGMFMGNTSGILPVKFNDISLNGIVHGSIILMCKDTQFFLNGKMCFST